MLRWAGLPPSSGSSISSSSSGSSGSSSRSSISSSSSSSQSRAHVSKAKHLDVSAQSQLEHGDQNGDLVFLSVLQTAALYSGKGPGPDVDATSSWATGVLCLVFVLIVFCTLYLLTAPLKAEERRGEALTGDYLARLGDRRTATNPDLGRLTFTQRVPEPGSMQKVPGSAQQLPGRPSNLGGPSPFQTGAVLGFNPPTGMSAASVSAPGPRSNSNGLAGGEKEIPQIYPELVMNAARTRLAVPVDPLSWPEFEVDVLGVSGVHLLCAAMAPRLGGGSTIEISLSSVSTLLAVVTPSLQIFDAKGKLFAMLSQTDNARYLVADASGAPLMALVPGGASGEARLTSQVGGQVAERAFLARRPANGALRAEHYEIVVAPGIDAVLSLACFMALIVFAIPAGPT